MWVTKCSRFPMIGGIKSRYAAYRYVMVGADFHSEGGAWRSIHAFHKHLDQHEAPALLVDLRRRDGWKQWVCALAFSPRIVVNGMAACDRWRVLIGLILRKDAAIYLHDTAYMLDAQQRSKPVRYRLLARLLRSHRVLCVSEQMAQLYRERFGTERATVVYEVTDPGPRPELDPGKVHIVMMGSLNRRKGYPLFARTAELAAERCLPWQFHWVGGLGECDLAPVSPVIRWWGWRNSALPLVEQCDIFLLSSEDDPQPLACLEALALGKRVVVYAGTGSAEVVSGLPGCRVFREHDAECVMEALEEALKEDPDVEATRALLAAISDVQAFERRLATAFDEGRGG